jgi:hypothetical protein
MGCQYVRCIGPGVFMAYVRVLFKDSEAIARVLYMIFCSYFPLYMIGLEMTLFSFVVIRWCFAIWGLLKLAFSWMWTTSRIFNKVR